MITIQDMQNAFEKWHNERNDYEPTCRGDEYVDYIDQMRFEAFVAGYTLASAFDATQENKHELQVAFFEIDETKCPLVSKKVRDAIVQLSQQSEAPDDGRYMPIDMTEAKRMIVQLRDHIADMKVKQSEQDHLRDATKMIEQASAIPGEQLPTFDDWMSKMRATHEVPFGTAYEIFARKAWNAALAAAPSHPIAAQGRLAIPIDAIANLLGEAMDAAVENGANSVSMPDEYVEIAKWLSAIAEQQGKHK